MRGKEIAETCWNHVLEHNINAYGYDKKTDVYFLCQSEKAAGCLNFNYGIIIWIGGSSDDTCVISAHEFGHEIQLELGLSLAEPYIPTDRQDSCMKTSYLYQECSR
jgi:hypothetical protein